MHQYVRMVLWILNKAYYFCHYYLKSLSSFFPDIASWHWFIWQHTFKIWLYVCWLRCVITVKFTFSSNFEFNLPYKRSNWNTLSYRRRSAGYVQNAQNDMCMWLQFYWNKWITSINFSIILLDLSIKKKTESNVPNLYLDNHATWWGDESVE